MIDERQRMQTNTKKWICFFVSIAIACTPVFASALGDLLTSIVGILIESIIGIFLNIFTIISNMFLKASAVSIDNDYFQKLLDPFDFFGDSDSLGSIGLLGIIGISITSLLFLVQFFGMLVAPMSGKQQKSSYISVIFRALVFIPATYIVQPLAMEILKQLQKVYSEIVGIVDINDGVNLPVWDEISGIFSDISLGNGLVDMGIFTEIAGMIIAALVIFLIMWNFIKLLFEMTQRFVVMIVYVYLSPLFVSLGASSTFANVPKQAFTIFMSSGILWILNAWIVGIAIHLIAAIDINPGGGLTGADKLFVWAVVNYGFLKIAQQLDDIFNAVGLSNVGLSGSLLDDMFGLNKVFKDFGKAMDNVKNGYSNFSKNGLFGKSKGKSAENPTSATGAKTISNTSGAKATQETNNNAKPTGANATTANATKSEGDKNQQPTGKDGVKIGNNQNPNGEKKPEGENENKPVTGEQQAGINAEAGKENKEANEKNGEEKAEAEKAVDGSEKAAIDNTSGENKDAENGEEKAEAEKAVDGSEKAAIDNASGENKEKDEDSGESNAKDNGGSIVSGQQSYNDEEDVASQFGTKGQGRAVTGGQTASLNNTAGAKTTSGTGTSSASGVNSSNTAKGTPQKPVFNNKPQPMKTIGNAIMNTGLVQGIRKTGENLVERKNDIGNKIEGMRNSVSTMANSMQDYANAKQMHNALSKASPEKVADAMSKIPNSTLNSNGAKDYIGQQLGLDNNTQAVTSMSVKDGQLSATIATQNADGSTSYSNVSNINGMNFNAQGSGAQEARTAAQGHTKNGDSVDNNFINGGKSSLVQSAATKDISETQNVARMMEEDTGLNHGHMVTKAIDGGDVYSSIDNVGKYGGPNNDNISKFQHQIGTDGKTTEFAAPSDWSAEQVSRCIVGQGSEEEQKQFESLKSNSKNMVEAQAAMAYDSSSADSVQYGKGSVIQGDADTSFTLNASGLTTKRVAENVGGIDTWQTVDQNGNEVARGNYASGTSAGSVARDIIENNSDYAKSVNNAASTSIVNDDITYNYNAGEVAAKHQEKANQVDYSFNGGTMKDGTNWSASTTISNISGSNDVSQGISISYAGESGSVQEVKIEPIGQVGDKMEYKITSSDGVVRKETTPEYITPEILLDTSKYSETASGNNNEKMFGYADKKEGQQLNEEVSKYRNKFGIPSFGGNDAFVSGVNKKSKTKDNNVDESQYVEDAYEEQDAILKKQRKKKTGKGKNSNNPTQAIP